MTKPTSLTRPNSQNSQVGLIPGVMSEGRPDSVMLNITEEDQVKDWTSGDRPDSSRSRPGSTRDRPGSTKDRPGSNKENKYSNLLDVPGVSLDPDGVSIIPVNHPTNTWTDSCNLQDKRFYSDFRPFFFLCQLSGLFPQVLEWELGFTWCYWGTALSLAFLTLLFFLLLFYIVQVCLTIKSGLIYVSYNLAWVVHIAHSIDWILVFFTKRKLFTQIWQGYRKFYRYLLEDRCDRSVIKFTWKTFIGWEVMFHLTAITLVLKSYSDRFTENGLHEELEGVAMVSSRNVTRKTILATIDQLESIQEHTSESMQHVLFWCHLACNIVCLNIVFLSEVFFMVMISIIFHAFLFLHRRIDGLLGHPDTIFSIQAIHDPVNEIENDLDRLVRNEMVARPPPITVRSLTETSDLRKECPDKRDHNQRCRARSLSSKKAIHLPPIHNKKCNNVGLSIRALWEQMEELIDLLDQVNDVFGMTLQFLSLEYLIFFPALIYFCIELYPNLGWFSLSGFLITGIILGIRSCIFTSVCARVNKEARAPINTLYRAYVKGDVSCHEYDLVNMFISRLSSTTIAVRTWSHVPITRQTFSVIFISVFGILAVLLQSESHNALL